MKITEIEYSCRTEVGDKTESLSYRATLECWENPKESLDLLRNMVEKELNLEGCHAELVSACEELRGACEFRVDFLEGLREKIKEEKRRLAQAEAVWEEFSEFLASHGVDPYSLTIEEFRKSRPANQPEDAGNDGEELEVREELYW